MLRQVPNLPHVSTGAPSYYYQPAHYAPYASSPFALSRPVYPAYAYQQPPPPPGLSPVMVTHQPVPLHAGMPLRAGHMDPAHWGSPPSGMHGWAPVHKVRVRILHASHMWICLGSSLTPFAAQRLLSVPWVDQTAVPSQAVYEPAMVVPVGAAGYDTWMR